VFIAFPPEKRALYDTIRKIIVTTVTQSEYVILIAFPWQLWLSERASMLRVNAVFLSC